LHTLELKAKLPQKRVYKLDGGRYLGIYTINLLVDVKIPYKKKESVSFDGGVLINIF
jgi:hypothetical protein